MISTIIISTIIGVQFTRLMCLVWLKKEGKLYYTSYKTLLFTI